MGPGDARLAHASSFSFQACRTPSRDEAGVELLMSYFIQLGFVESRFFPPTRHMGLLFTW
jgi:hypothetical protein